MAVRRCPACRNLVDVETGECPICGRSYVRAIVGMIARWAIILCLLAAVAYHFVRRHSNETGEKHGVSVLQPDSKRPGNLFSEF
jgi:hypothetical protein